MNIPRRDFEEAGKHLALGEQININHDDCPDGRDTRGRLYVKRKEDGLVAFCHNCGGSGFIATRFGHYKAKAKAASCGAGTHRISGGYSGATGAFGDRLPEDFTGATSEWSPRARAWFFRYGLDEGSAYDYGLGYSEREQRVIIPIYRDGEVLGYQTRRVEPNDEGPKYLTQAYEKPLFWCSNMVELLSSKPLVITEDVLSAIKVSRFCPSVALLTATASKSVIDWLVKTNSSEYIIFLDNDNRTVRKAQLALKNKLEMFAPTRIITADKDPKEHTYGELECLLTTS